LAEIRLKRSNARSLVSATDCGRTNAKSGRILFKLTGFHPNFAQKTNHGSIFGQLEQYSTKIGGGK
jgi:hypothetical protein